VRRALRQQVSTHGARQTTDHYVHCATTIVAHPGIQPVPWNKTLRLPAIKTTSLVTSKRVDLLLVRIDQC